MKWQEKCISKLKKIKKRYFVLFGFLLLFSIYNTITLRGFYYTENYPHGRFGFIDWWHGYANDVPNQTIPEEDQGRSYIPGPETIHDISEAHEWYGSILGTVVFVKWKWIGLHFGDHMILIDTWVPYVFSETNHICGHPYYILHRYSNEKQEMSQKQFERSLSKFSKEIEVANEWQEERVQNVKLWMKNVKMYRIITIVCYIGILFAIAGGVTVRQVKKRLKRRRLMQEE